jgi:CBS-domain-containing membrane protein
MEKRKEQIEKGNVENLVRPAVGASIAIALALWVVGGNKVPFVLASLGGSTVFLFALSQSESAQPRALFGGHFGGALIGILSYQVFGGALWVSVLAVVLTMTYMVLTRTIHPPAGANPLLMIYNHAGLYELIKPVGIGVVTLFIVAVLWSRLGRGPRYPLKW